MQEFRYNKHRHLQGCTNTPWNKLRELADCFTALYQLLNILMVMWACRGTKCPEMCTEKKGNTACGDVPLVFFIVLYMVVCFVYFCLIL